MHVYLIPPDPALKQLIHKEESSSGYEVMKKPHPDKYLKMSRGFTLQATEETARILPPEITLRVNNQNFYEVYIENPDGNFNLELLQTKTAWIRKTAQPVWFCEIRKDDHPKSGCVEEATAVKSEVSVPAASSSREMPRSVKQLLAETLEDLSKDNLDKFIFQLLDRREEPRVRRCRVEGKSRLEVVDVLVSTFTEDQAVDVTVEILRSISCKQQAERLMKDNRQHVFKEPEQEQKMER
ncbi:uncharacterized protein LOC129379991 isoform X2 [Poeciliopsis prolifica]|uniref:uncharacterized protein LOC129379991 isoform X2 n=1 Tax=Poeciliopsis prolifica TaxID=188132 RepID=UPI002413E79C|nr:uncharacterized protein LOC129379991 isoform X2 [Poeciliopsis prolifica]